MEQTRIINFSRKREWEIKVEFTMHSQERWFHRKVSGKSIKRMISNGCKYFYSNCIKEYNKKLLIRDHKSKNSMVLILNDINSELATMKLIVITMLNKIAFDDGCEVTIDIYKNRVAINEHHNNAKYNERNEKGDK